MLIMFLWEGGGGAQSQTETKTETRETGERGRRARERKKVHSCHYSTWDGRQTIAEQSINPASVCFMRHWVRASLPEGTNSFTRQLCYLASNWTAMAKELRVPWLSEHSLISWFISCLSQVLFCLFCWPSASTLAECTTSVCRTPERERVPAGGSIAAEKECVRGGGGCDAEGREGRSVTQSYHRSFSLTRGNAFVLIVLSLAQQSEEITARPSLALRGEFSNNGRKPESFFYLFDFFTRARTIRKCPYLLCEFHKFTCK